MSELESHELILDSSDKLLLELGIPSETLLVNKQSIFFGDGSTSLEVAGATIVKGDVDAYDMFDEIVPEEKLGTFDYVLSKDCPSLITDMADFDSVGFLAATVRSLQIGGELRIVAKGLEGVDDEERDQWQSDYDRMLSDRGLAVRTTLADTLDGTSAHFIIKREIPKRSFVLNGDLYIPADV